MIRQAFFICALTGVTAGCALATPKPEPTAKIVQKEGVTQKANKILYKASNYLTQAKTFQFKANIMRDIMLDDDIQVQFGGVSNVTVQRPNKLRAIFNGDERSRRSYFDGNTLTLYSVSRQFYVEKKIPGTIGDALDFVFEKFGFSVPLADLVYPDPYSILIENVDKGFWIGKHKVGGVLCDHLVFKQDLIDWQIWIEADNTPLIRKILITYKTEEGYPKYVAVLSDWKINPPVTDADFKFTPPDGVDKIEFLPLQKIYGDNEQVQSNDIEKVTKTAAQTEVK